MTFVSRVGVGRVRPAELVLRRPPAPPSAVPEAQQAASQRELVRTCFYCGCVSGLLSSQCTATDSQLLRPTCQRRALPQISPNQGPAPEPSAISFVEARSAARILLDRVFGVRQLRWGEEQPLLRPSQARAAATSSDSRRGSRGSSKDEFRSPPPTNPASRVPTPRGRGPVRGTDDPRSPGGARWSNPQRKPEPPGEPTRRQYRSRCRTP
jgi:hypothetical protein